jgi:drug/metabolite transporter (DMT)-like permease
MQNPLVLMTLSALFFSLMSWLAKVAQSELPVIEVVFFRSFIAALVLLEIRRRRIKPGDPFWGRQKRLLFIRGVLGTISLILYFYALDGLPVADAMLLNQCSPIFVLFLAGYFLAEPIRLDQLAILPVTLAGIALILEPQFAAFGVHGLAGLGSALVAAGVYVCIRKMSGSEATEVIVLYFTASASLFSLPAMLVDFVLPSPTSWLVLVGVGLLSVAAQLFMTAAFRFDRAGRVAMGGAMGPVFAALWDFIYWRRVPGWSTVLGAALILGSLMLLDLVRRREVIRPFL